MGPCGDAHWHCEPKVHQIHSVINVVSRLLDFNGLSSWVSKYFIKQLTDSRQHFGAVMALALVRVRGMSRDIRNIKPQAPASFHVVFKTTSCA